MGRGRSQPPLLRRDTALILGYGGILLGAWSLWQAYEVRGQTRPFLTKFLPGA